MSSFALVPTLQTLAPDVAALVPALIVLLSGGLVGMSIKNMFDSIMSDDESDADDGDDMGGGGLMGDDGGGDDLGGLGGLDDGDDMDGFGDGEFGDMEDATGPDTDELEHRLDELENEVGSLSSTVNTVRTENESISESVDEVQENVRKLLDIYEMVTRGVNPFADDVDAGMGGGSGMGDDSFGLFDDEGGEDEGEDIDDDVVNADAEGFFDEDLVEDDGMAMDEEMSIDEGGDVFDDDLDDDGEFDEEFEEADDMSVDDGLDMDDENSDDDSEGGKSFAELKDEYESGDAEWAEGEDLLEDDGENLLEDDDTPEGDGFDADEGDLEDDDLFDEVIEGDEDGGTEAVEVAPEPEPVAEPEPEPEPASDATAQASETDTSDDGKPYLATMPEGFAADMILIEWLEFLTSQAGYRETSRAIDYYETIGWIDQSVADDLAEYLRGFDDIADSGDGLTIDHHTESLRYISQLDEDSGADAVALSKLVGGGSDGIQR